MLDVDFEVLTALVMNSSILWNMTVRSPLRIDRRFGGTCRLHLQGRRISQERNQVASRALSKDYTVLHPKRQKS
jgi:hypothetical protein